MRCGGEDWYLKPDGSGRKCRSCQLRIAARWGKNNYPKRRAAVLAQKYGITPSHVEVLLRLQGGRCAICRTDSPGGKWGRLNVDHCHLTGRVRGLLCDPCNRGIGFLKESPERLRIAAAYLEVRGE